MTKLLMLLIVSLIVFGSVLHADDKPKTPPSLQFTMNSLDGKPVELAKYQGQVVMIVNVASECGLTPQYEQLQKLHEKYKGQGLSVVGVPCNQFGMQEPGTAEEIQQFCRKNYGVTFDLLAKVDVNGEKACPLYKHLKSITTRPKGPGEISWNFEKFLLGRSGEVVGRFAPATSPDAQEVVKAVEAELARK
jgi:glutathione peroxidase